MKPSLARDWLFVLMVLMGIDHFGNCMAGPRSAICFNICISLDTIAGKKKLHSKVSRGLPDLHIFGSEMSDDSFRNCLCTPFGSVAGHAVGNPRYPRQTQLQQRTQGLALIQIGIAKIGAELVGMGDDFQ